MLNKFFREMENYESATETYIKEGTVSEKQ
jgi:hypothetical protein